MSRSDRVDVVVIGGGNAGLCAAHAAEECGSRVVVLEKAPLSWVGGNTFFTAGAFRVPHAGLDDLRDLLPKIGAEQAAMIELAPYPKSAFRADMERLTDGRCDPQLTSVLVEDAPDVLRWLANKGLAFRLMTERQSFSIGDKRCFWGGLAIGTEGGGKRLVEQHLAAAATHRIDIRFASAAMGVTTDPKGRVDGVICRDDNGEYRLRAGAVVLAAGGFEADPRLRAQYLGERWDLAKVRGTPFNTGDGIRMALDVGAQPYGHWSGCHSVAWDVVAPTVGDRERTNSYTRGSYPIGIVVNANGDRFLDEGEDMRVFTYAKYGAQILHQKASIAFQIYDQSMVSLLRADEYDNNATQVREESIGELANRLGIPRTRLDHTVRTFNEAVEPGSFDPTRLDGKSTRGLEPPKSNWAQPIATPPFLAYPVTCGITFTFGGVRIGSDACVLNNRGERIQGLMAAGELVGGLFYWNYPGGTGLTAGAVFGRRAGISASKSAGV